MAGKDWAIKVAMPDSSNEKESRIRAVEPKKTIAMRKRTSDIRFARMM